MYLVCRYLHSFPTRRSSDLISPLSTTPPPVLQHWWVRASTDCHIRFTLAMDSSRGFGSHRRNCRLVQTRLPSGSPALTLVNLLRADRKSTRLNSSHRCISYADISTLSLHDALPI